MLVTQIKIKKSAYAGELLIFNIKNDIKNVFCEWG